MKKTLQIQKTSMNYSPNPYITEKKKKSLMQWNLTVDTQIDIKLFNWNMKLNMT